MRKFFVLALLSSVVAVVSAVGCGGNGDSSGGNDGGGGSTTTTSSTTSTTSTTTSTSLTTNTETGDCTGALNGTACAVCVEEQCCSHLSECLDDPLCKGCLKPGANLSQCTDNELYTAVILCGENACPEACAPIVCDAPAASPSGGSCVVLGGGTECNPITNEPCDTAGGESCDASMSGFSCYPPPNDQMLCQECGDSAGYCQPGMACVGVCARYCCDDGDCASGVCETGVFANPAVGYCKAKGIEVPCDGPANGTCNPAKETCDCADCKATAFCTKDQCTTDGTCNIQDSCTCPDCDEAPTCVCDYNNVCDSFTESCKCPDCWGNPNCADNPQEPCTDDGTCEPTEFCVCLDCKDTGGCMDPNHCTEDGICAPYEGCVCTDCATEPTCL